MRHGMILAVPWHVLRIHCVPAGGLHLCVAHSEMPKGRHEWYNHGLVVGVAYFDQVECAETGRIREDVGFEGYRPHGDRLDVVRDR